MVLPPVAEIGWEGRCYSDRSVEADEGLWVGVVSDDELCEEAVGGDGVDNGQHKI